MKNRGDDPVRPEGAAPGATPQRRTRPMPGTSTSTMATPMPTTRPTPTTSGLCAAESGAAGTGLAGPVRMFDLQALSQAYQACRRGKRQSRDTQRYEARLLDQLVSARDALASFGWRPSRAFSFVVEAPKRRQIHAAPFADRVVHQLLVSRLERLYEPVFIHDCYANRRGKGTHAAVDRLQAFMRRASHGGRRPAFALQLDIANCFNSIHRPTLFRLLQRRLLRAVRRQRLARGEARALQAHCRALLTADPTAGVRRVGPPARFARVPPHKRLGALGPVTGLPIGNLTSQFFANVYLNELDQYVKHTLKARWYVRYVDDMVLLHHDPAVLRRWRAAIERFLAGRLRLRLKQPAEPRTLAAGLDFLGYIVRPFYRLLRRRVVHRFYAVLRDFQRHHVRPHAVRLPPTARERLRARIASFLGQLRHARGYRLWRRTLERFPWLRWLFEAPEAALGPGAGSGRRGRLRPAWEPARVSGLAGQYRSFRRRFPAACVLLQVGKHWWVAAGHAGPLQGLRPAADVHRPGLGHGLEFPGTRLKTLRRRLRRAGCAHLLVAQTGHLRTGFKRRAWVLYWQPATDRSHPLPAIC